MNGEWKPWRLADVDVGERIEAKIYIYIYIFLKCWKPINNGTLINFDLNHQYSTIFACERVRINGFSRARQICNPVFLCLEYDPDLLGLGLFSGANLLLVLGRVIFPRVPRLERIEPSFGWEDQNEDVGMISMISIYFRIPLVDQGL